MTDSIKLHGAPDAPVSNRPSTEEPHLREYGTDQAELQAMIATEPALGERIDRVLPYTFAQVAFAVRAEMARTLEDVLSRRTRSLLLDANRGTACGTGGSGADRARAGDAMKAWAASQVAAFDELARSSYSL